MGCCQTRMITSFILRGTVHPNVTKTNPLPSCTSIYPSKLFCCELPSFGDTERREVCSSSLYLQTTSVRSSVHVHIDVCTKCTVTLHVYCVTAASAFQQSVELLDVVTETSGCFQMYLCWQKPDVFSREVVASLAMFVTTNLHQYFVNKPDHDAFLNPNQVVFVSEPNRSLNTALCREKYMKLKQPSVVFRKHT